MKYVDEYRKSVLAANIVRAIRRLTTRPHTIMEVCGGQTHTILKYGIDSLLPPEVTLLHGPGCPVCVTPVEVIDKAVEIASHPDAIFCTFGDMLRVPGSDRDLLSTKADGADVRTVYSPLDSVKMARDNPRMQIIFFAIGFETTAPANAMAILQAECLGLSNFSVLVSQMLIPPAMKAILASPENRIDGFLAPGHVCTVTGYAQYEEIAHDYAVPIVVTGFEPADILEGIFFCVKQLENGRANVENQYVRSVKLKGNAAAQTSLNEVFRIVPKRWRGIGEIPKSGLALSEEYLEFDAEKRFGAVFFTEDEETVCISGVILQGVKKPSDCPAFGETCSPSNPLGATMVSAEGICAAYYKYRREA